MPRVQPDHDLQRRAKRYVADCNENILFSAKTLNIQYDFLRRFLETGRASEHNRRALIAALEANATAPQETENAILSKIVQNRDTLGLTRAVLNDLLAAVDALEAGRRTEKEQVNP